MGLVCTTRTNSKVTLINDNDYSCCRTCLTNRMGSISRHITLLVINNLGGGHTHTHIHTHTHKHTYRHPRNQVSAGLWPARAWFKNTLHGNHLGWERLVSLANTCNSTCQCFTHQLLPFIINCNYTCSSLTNIFPHKNFPYGNNQGYFT